jgi:UDP:flavonoid glycosyltransferase YjiC (YdhE family)
MKILITSLQVSESGSKGHLHPALELALEAKRLGHAPIFMPLPSRLGQDDEAQLKRAGIEYILPPELPKGVIKTADELAALASDRAAVHKAYHSFMVAPLDHQFQSVRRVMEEIRPDALIYDLLVYSAPLAARSLGIPDVGFCAGLKLIAPEMFQEVYGDISEKLNTDVTQFLNSINEQARFKHLELLSERANFVFSTKSMIGHALESPAHTHLIGPIHYSSERGDYDGLDDCLPKENIAVLSFGSVQDPADFPDVTEAIIKATEECGLTLLVSSRKLKSVDRHVVVRDYLPIPALLPHAKVYFHHGGANSFAEAALIGTPQILIPLTTDQPIQGFFLKESQSGFAIPPSEISERSLRTTLDKILDANHPVHQKMRNVSLDYQANRGQERVIRTVEKLVAVQPG